ncbi:MULTISPECIES: hypothetical protein [Kangiella]|uniref:Cation transporter n=1 Tax=Kangiella koreensis (strain DSM 16069 / JCM 12317 / KCTC 12182 / SW-125) TaxID=523791 RepID=C7RBT3_KANKD|nr:hypothetical protein [Kangiella koreensis]ACV26725.1 conserved hypothetical protein [Kangiella koreensis DSM 16069]
MKHQEHRLGVSEINLVARHLKLEPCAEQCIEAAIQTIDQLYGLDHISFDEASQVLSLAYDASRLSLDLIEEIMEKNGVEVSHGWWTHFKEDYYKFVDQNVKDNANHKPWSCHSSPRIPRKKQK